MSIVAVSAGLLTGVPAQASNFGSTSCGGSPTNCVSLTNNIWHVIRWDGQVGNQIPNIDEAVLWALSNVYNPTDLVAYRDESDSLPDVWVHDFDYGYNNGVVGWVVCSSDNTGTGGSHPNHWCRGQHARFNAYFYYNYYGFFDTDAQSRNVACHELGHTLGLRHRTDTRSSCMWTYAGDGGASTLDSHDRSHINGTY
jgi:hypothetical protein